MRTADTYVRARIDVISEMPAQWRLLARRWSRVNRSRKRTVDDAPMPDVNVQHLLAMLLVDSKRARDTEASTMNMQLVTWRDGRAANTAFASGAGDALRTWRQP